MLRGQFDPNETTPAQLTAAYRTHLAETVDRLGADQVAAATRLDRRTLETLADGRPPLTVADAAAILGVDPARPDPATLAAEARDLLVMRLAAAGLDVDAVAASAAVAVSPEALRGQLEGRQPLDLATYAAVHSHVC